MNNETLNIDESTKIDKILLINCEIAEIEWLEYLEELNIAKVNDNKQGYITNSGQTFEYLKITKNGCIDSLTAGVAYGKQYCTLQLSVNKGEIRNFEGNTVDEYMQQLADVQEFLKFEFGILIDFSNAKLKSLEINRTFKIEYPFDEYSRAIQLILSQMPKMQKITTVTNLEQGKNETFAVWNKKECTAKSRSFKKIIFYNKGKQCETSVILDSDYMRFEIKLFGTRNIKDNLKVKKFVNLTQEMVDTWFSKQVDTLIIKPLQKWQKTRNKLVKTILKEELEKGGTWLINTLRRFTAYELEYKTPLILDISEIYQIVDKLPVDDKSRVKSRFLQQSLKYERIFTNNDNSKLMEILNKLTI